MVIVSENAVFMTGSSRDLFLLREGSRSSGSVASVEGPGVFTGRPAQTRASPLRPAATRLRRLRLPRLPGQGDGELFAGVDVELREDLVQMPLDGARAQEELRAYLRVRVIFAGQLGDLGFLGGEVAAGVVRA